MADIAGAEPAPGRVRRTLLRQETLESTDRVRRPYAAPRMVVYGRLEELTLTVSISKNKNDSVNGGNNLKT
jgi:hypothetical protein